MGTHPIFESDFDCLTEMGIFKQIGALVGKRAVPKPKSSDAPAVSGILNTFVKEADDKKRYQEAALLEAQKHIPAPVIQEDARGILSEEAIDAKLKELERKNAFSPDYLDMLEDVDVKKPVELDEIDSALTQHRYSARKRFSARDDNFVGEEVGEGSTLPKGKCLPGTLADIISNHQLNPSEWNVENVAEHLSLRHLEVESFLAHFDLITEHSNLMLEEQNYENLELPGEDQFSIRDDMPKKL